MMRSYDTPWGVLDVLQTGPFSVNTYIVPLGADDVLIIDPAACKFSNDQGKITEYLAAHKKHPVGIFLTHGHFDHILGIPTLVEAFGDIPIAVSAEDESALTDESLDFHQGTQALMGGDRRIVAALQEVIKDSRGRIRTFRDGDTLDKVFCSGNGSISIDEHSGTSTTVAALKQWKVIATPGHTMGSVCLYLKAANGSAGCLISGDTVFYQGWGRTDIGGSTAAIMRSLKMLKKSIPPKTLVFPGHDQYGFEFIA